MRDVVLVVTISLAVMFVSVSGVAGCQTKREDCAQEQRRGLHARRSPRLPTEWMFQCGDRSLSGFRKDYFLSFRRTWGSVRANLVGVGMKPYLGIIRLKLRTWQKGEGVEKYKFKDPSPFSTDVIVSPRDVFIKCRFFRKSDGKLTLIR